MPSAYPSTVAALTNPNPSDKLNSPSHSTIEGNQNNEISQVEAFVGTLSSVQGTLMYDVRAAASNGGGHVQTANKGGTGQTSYTKGDLLAASSSSVLSKLAVGANDTVLTADSTAASGVKWGVNSNTAPTVKTVIPQPLLPIEPGSADVVTSISFPDNPGSVLLGKVSIPTAIVVNRLTFYGNASLPGHKLGIRLYTEDGTRSVLTALASVASADASSVVTVVQGASIRAGNYYVTATPSTLASSILASFWKVDASTPVLDIATIATAINGVIPRPATGVTTPSILVSSITGGIDAKVLFFRLDE